MWDSSHAALHFLKVNVSSEVLHDQLNNKSEFCFPVTHTVFVECNTLISECFLILIELTVYRILKNTICSRQYGYFDSSLLTALVCIGILFANSAPDDAKMVRLVSEPQISL